MNTPTLKEETMKKTKIVILSVLSIVATLLIINTAMAIEVTGWYYCSINEIQTTATTSGAPIVYMNITEDEGAFADEWVPLDRDYAKVGLATALTAVSTSKAIRVRLELSEGTVQIFRLRLIN